MTTCLQLVSEQFPLLRDRVSWRFEHDELFRELCHDYESCVGALERLGKTAPEALRREYSGLKLRLEAEHTSAWNRRNASAPYATPWRPRDYMSAFAFIPRYLEVNQNICAAVYLRHPVARPGLAEVPTPFHVETGQLAFNWYLRRR